MVDSAKRNMWRERIEQCLSSGMSNKEWCLLNGVSRSTFYFWVARFKKEELSLLTAQNTAEWIEVTKDV
jgi:transposase